MAAKDAKKLTPKQEKFCTEYMLTGDASKAARAAGYSAKTAGNIGYENLKKPEIRQRLDDMRAEVADLVGLTPAMMAAELKRLALSDMGDFVSFDASGVTLRASDDVDTRCIQSVTETTGPQQSGSMAIKLHDKVGAIDRINKMMGWNAPEKTEVTGKDGGPIEVSDAKSVLAARLARLNRTSDPPSA